MVRSPFRPEAAVHPFRETLLGIERLEERAAASGRALSVETGRRFGRRTIYPRLGDNARLLRRAYLQLADDGRRGRFVSAAADWLLDNYHVLSAEIAGVRRDLPPEYYRQLPALATPEMRGYPRLYPMAVELVRHGDSRVDRERMRVFLTSFQMAAPLTIGELWAWPSMLRVVLIENLRRLAEQIMESSRQRTAADVYLDRDDAHTATRRQTLGADVGNTVLVQLLHRAREFGVAGNDLRTAIADHLAARGTTIEDAIRDEHRLQGVTQASVANAITSLRLCATLNWREFVESVSRVDRALRLDPAGVYAELDFLSRDTERQAVERLAPRSGPGQLRVAESAVELARAAATARSPSDRRAHVGYYLIDRGRAELESRLGDQPTLGERLRRAVKRHAAAWYLGSVFILTALAVGAIVAAVFHADGRAAPIGLAMAAILLLTPASEFVIASVQRLVAHLVPPRRLLRLALDAGVPAHARTVVIVPTLLTDTDAVERLLEQLEVLALGNPDPHVHFAILSDFTDAPTATRPGDAGLVDAGRRGIEGLNERFHDPDRFFLLHRERRWNERERVWMGWERKRGKIEEFNRLLRGATDTSFTTIVGNLAALAGARYCLTLDSDTRLPRGGAKDLVGILEFILHRPRIDPATRAVVEGYGILQPRVSVTMTSAAGSRFARLYAGHTGVDPYTTAVSDTYQDVFDEGIYTGKGLYDIEAFTQALDGRVPENAVLSHDLFEGLFARVALVTDIEVVDDYPSSVLAHARRTHRWVRGDWQILRWLFPRVPTRTGWAANHLSVIARWKILDNLRRSLVAPATMALLVAGWTVLPGRPWLWTAAALASMGFPLVGWAIDTVRGRVSGEPFGMFLRSRVEELGSALARIALQVTFLAQQAWDMLHAIGTTLTRLRTHRGLLEWESAAVSAARLGSAQPYAFYARMPASPIIAAMAAMLMMPGRLSAWQTAVPILVLWALAPLVAALLSRPIVWRRSDPSSATRVLFESVARDTWQYFSTYMTAAHHFLPPDNVQVVPDLRIANRTSPTNIGLALLSMLSAHDLGFLDVEDLIGRLDATVASMEQLERHEGHFLNWYDTNTLAPLMPRYVSTVDSGNLAAALIAVSVALRELQGAPASRAWALAVRVDRLVDAMHFEFLYDRGLRLFAIGYRLADDAGPGRLDANHYDLLASEARLASFVAIAKGDVPEAHWFHLGRSVVSVHGVPVLLSWSASMFEYLMPLLLTRSYPGTLLDASCRMAVTRQIAYAGALGVPWGISESTYNVVDRHDTYQYKAFGVPGLGLKRGLAEELVIAPYATGLAAMIDPDRSAANLRRLAGQGGRGPNGFFDAIDYTARGGSDAPEPVDRRTGRGTVVRTYLAHHQGMTLVALANALLQDRMVDRFHRDPRVKATEMILQERIPRNVAARPPRPIETARDETPPPPLPVRRLRSPHTVFPHTQFLSNGRYVVAITQAGGGASQYQGLSVTRARYDRTRDAGSQFLYLRDVRDGAVWSATYLPTRAEPDDYQVTFRPERACVHRRDGDLLADFDVAVSTQDDMEVRRLAVTNQGHRVREIDITSYVEIALAAPSDDLAHPAFGKLFLETDYLADHNALICRRRPREAGPETLWGVHVLSRDDRTHGPVEWETDRARFLGRGRTVFDPVALDGRPLSGTLGAVLDPVLSLRQRVRIPPGERVRVTFTTGIARDRATAEALARKYATFHMTEQVFLLGVIDEQGSLRHLGLSSEDGLRAARLASRVFGADESLRDAPDLVAANTLGQSGLWGYSISGDLPIVVVRVVRTEDMDLVRDVLQAQEYWRLKGLSADVVILNEFQLGYRDESQAQLAEVLANGPWRTKQHQPGGVFLLRADRMADADRTLLLAVARVVLRGERGSLQAQLDRPYAGPAVARPFVGTLGALRPAAVRDAPPRPSTVLSNGIGGFTDDGRTYTIALAGDAETPMPWANVMANETFGTVVSASGSAYTWSENSRENRLTPFENDPVPDPVTETILIRDDVTGDTWAPTPGPLRRRAGEGLIEIRHQHGLTHFARHTRDLDHELEVFVDATEPVKYSRLTITNRSPVTRRLSVWAYAELTLGPPRDDTRRQVVTSFVGSLDTVFAVNAYNQDFAGRTAFLRSSEPVISHTGDRADFLGRHGAIGRPAALSAATLSDRTGAGLDPCAAVQIHLTIGPGDSKQALFLLGQGRTHDDAVRLIGQCGTLGAADRAKEAATSRWAAMLRTIEVRTPDDSFDVMMNGWLLYQTLSCRIWARTGYYQPGGAFGFRDQLQDVLALLHARPDVARAHLLRAAGRQFREGDVQHWWHEPHGRGVRTRCSDDLLWLPFAVAEYVRTTGDRAILDEAIPFLDAPVLTPDQSDAYQQPVVSSEVDTLYGHCVRAIDRGITHGAHGLPLFGTGDWNDGMNRVGAAGRGESVWLGFFLYRVLSDLSAMAETRGDHDRADRGRQEMRSLSARLDEAWDGDWFRRGYYDDGTPLGSREDDECRIDSISQSWAVLSGAVPRAQAERALDAVRTLLVQRGPKVVVLLEPAFDHSAQDPGYIKGYPPGIRENGGQYTHAAVWVVMALAELGHGEEAVQLFHMLNPVNASRTPGDAMRYKLEPYVVAGDVYARPPHAGRGGWSWYTGSSGWLYRAGLERILGIVRRGATIAVNPCIPSAWPEFSVTWRFGRSVYDIHVLNPDRRSTGVASSDRDGVRVPADAIPLVDDGEPHQIVIVLGDPPAASRPTVAASLGTV